MWSLWASGTNTEEGTPGPPPSQFPHIVFLILAITECRKNRNSNIVNDYVLFLDSDHNPHHLCLLSYRMPSDFTPVIAPHGNSKTKKPFFPTLPSTKMEIEIQNRSCGPKSALGIVSEKLGGIVDANSPCELPRNERQISYIKSKSTSSNLVLADQVFAMMRSAKEEDVVGKFVR